jgi:hypothetical protein
LLHAEEDDTREKLSRRMRERRAEELKRWGYSEGGTPQEQAAAEAFAEAASLPDRVIPLISLAHRRFRTEVIDPLLAVPKVKGKAKKRKPPAGSGGKAQGPKGRLARSIKALLESKEGDAEEKRRLVEGMAMCLQAVGIRIDHPLRIRMDKFLATTTVVG